MFTMFMEAFMDELMIKTDNMGKCIVLELKMIRFKS